MTMRLTTDEILDNIRYDHPTKRGSVLDVVQLVTGCAQNHASQSLASTLANFPEVPKEMTEFKFPGRGQRLTPVAPLHILFRIMALCPGSRAKKFNGGTVDVFTRALGGDASLAREIMDRERQLVGTRLEHAADGVTTTVDGVIALLDEPMEEACDAGVIYTATSSFLPFFKTGYWTGSIEALASRYKTYYGPQVELSTWACAQCRDVESKLLRKFEACAMGGELLNKTCLPEFVECAGTLTV